ncbi:MAG: SDR family NAD(P)-dependent oxidoreductase, partial [Proteobacteria bacterium]|nr:SDR family NAD(P)-dependent oxidoreductase [Pseudomonadota bacterium]
MPTVLVTGANRGLGLEFTRQYAADGWRVHATCRDKNDAADLLSVRGDVLVHQFDVTDGQGIENLTADIGDGPIDILANNAGVLEPWPSEFGNTDYEGWMNAFRVNTAAPLRLSERFAGQVAKSERKIIFAVTSHLGSLAGNSGGMYVYGSAKAALNSVMKSLAL